MPYFLYASFPNSRVKPRPSTQNSVTYRTALAVAPALTLVSPPNPNRTYIMLKNLSSEVSLVYVYATVVLVNPSVVATLGVTKQCVIFGGQLYQKQDEGETTNWNPVNIQDVGETIDQLQTASLDEIADSIYMAYTGAPLNPVLVAVDEGRG